MDGIIECYILLTWYPFTKYTQIKSFFIMDDDFLFYK